MASTAPSRILSSPTLPAAANALSVRFSVPDGGADFATPLDVFVDDVFVKRLELTSRYSWYYGAYPFTKNASDGRPHHFFDTAHFMLPARAAAGRVEKRRRRGGSTVFIGAQHAGHDIG